MCIRDSPTSENETLQYQPYVRVGLWRWGESHNKIRHSSHVLPVISVVLAGSLEAVELGKFDVWVDLRRGVAFHARIAVQTPLLQTGYVVFESLLR